MRFTEETVDHIQLLVELRRSSQLLNINVEGITVGASVELACRGLAWERVCDDLGMQLIAKWRRQNSFFGSLLTDLQRMSSPGRTDLQPRPFEHLYLSSITELGNLWDCYFKRFELSLRQNGFSTPKSAAMAAAMREMAENVWNHSGPTESMASPGIMAYHVVDGTMAYAVGDLGRGILESLRETYPDLQTSRDALAEAILQNRTRHRQYARGAGFATVLRSLADLNGVLRFRSGDAALVITGKEDERAFDSLTSPDGRGLQLAVRCAPAGNNGLIFLS